jgi:hypothetical protein
MVALSLYWSKNSDDWLGLWWVPLSPAADDPEVGKIILGVLDV